MYTLSQLPGRSAIIAGEPWLYFSGTGYLGAAWNRELQDLVQAGIRQFGLHFGGSRLSNIQIDIFGEAEAFLAKHLGAEQALLLSSGTLAGQLLMKTLSDYGEVSLAPGAHPAIWGGGIPWQGSWESWVESVEEQTQVSGPALILASNSFDPLAVKRYDFSWLKDLVPQRELILVIDDSHGFGILGAEGKGVYPQLVLPEGVQLLLISSLGKAWGIPAGMIVTPRAWRDRLLNSPHFGGASPPSPAFLWAMMQGQPLYAAALQKLRQNLDFFVQNLPRSSDFRFFANYPVFYAPNGALAAFLAQKKILISSFPYPTSQDALVTRIVLSSLHTNDDLLILLESLHLFAQSQKPPP